MGFTRSTTDISVHQKLGDYPNLDNGLTPDDLKRRYDYPAETIQRDLNNLEVELEKETASTNLGASSLDENDISNANVQDKLNKIYTEFKDVRDGGVKDASLVTSKIQDGAITNSKIQDGAINTAKIEDSAIVTNKIADLNVTTNKIADGAITGEKVDVNVKKAVNINAEKMNANDTSENNVQAKINKLYEDMISMTQGSVADNSVTTSKIANDAVTEAKIADSNVTNIKIASQAVSNEKIMDKTITEEKIIEGLGLIPRGLICMWSGSDIPIGWLLCDGNNGTPDLRDRFIVGAGNEYFIGNSGGEKAHQLTTTEMPSHKHATHVSWDYLGDNYVSYSGTGTILAPKEDYLYKANSLGNQERHFYVETSSTGSGQAHENRPPYYALAFIMKA